MRRNILSLPKNAINYLKGLICVFENANCMCLSEISKCSHDSLTRILKKSRFNWQTLLINLGLRIFGNLSGGYLIIDDTAINKQFAKYIENLSWVFDSKIGKCILGLNLVMIAWSNGKITIPLAIKVYQKSNGKTKIDLALELIEWARKLGFKPDYITFDSWYSADRILKKIHKLGWAFITQIKKNRKLNNIQVRRLFPNPYWMQEGKLSNGLKISVVRHGKKYFITNDLSLEKNEILSMYKGRWLVETIFRMLHSKLGLDECESRSLTAQTAHFYLCLMAYTILEKEKFITRKSTYQIKKECSFDFKKADRLINKLCFQSA